MSTVDLLWALMITEAFGVSARRRLMLARTARGSTRRPLIQISSLALIWTVMFSHGLLAAVLVGACSAADVPMARFGEHAWTLNHDVRTPLCALTLNAQLLALTLTDHQDSKVQEKLHSIERDVRRIKEHIDRLIEAKALAAATEEPEGVQVG